MKRFLTALAVCLLLCVSAGTSNAMESRPSDCYGIPWCGCFARHALAVVDPGRAFNSALRWLDWGSRASEPRPGDIVVYRRHGGGHVGMLVKHIKGSIWYVKSGNDGHAVRTRPRSIANAVGIRRGNTILASVSDETMTRTVLKDKRHVKERITRTHHMHHLVRNHRGHSGMHYASMRHVNWFTEAGGRLYMESTP